MSNVAVITDSAASLPPALAKKWGIIVVPLQVIVDDVSFPEGEEITPTEVLTHLLDGRAVSTSQPSIAAFEAAYAQAAASGAQAAVVVLISGEMSGTVNAARAAAQGAAIPVRVVDTRTLAMAAGFAAVAAAARAAAGAGIDDVAQRAQDVAASSLCVFTLDSLEFLRRGGRVNAATAAIGNALSLRPVMAIRDGKVEVLERVRTTARARSAMLDMVDTHVGGLARPAAAIMVLGDEQFGSDAALLVENRHPELAMLVRTPVSAVLAVHTGPGTLAAVVVDLPDDVR
ncbi:DegV family protein [Demequina aurantiaca]|uniref:DegV family protein n=1 Tax=Demequina aurantiaca TaxID=676200 RepID=UPI00078675C4|nr:DegV family protein [Demequina aurantiaca]